MKTSKVVIYARVSSREQEREGFSIPAQLKLLREYAQKNGYEIVAEYSDAETAKKQVEQTTTLCYSFLEQILTSEQFLSKKRIGSIATSKTMLPLKTMT